MLVNDQQVVTEKLKSCFLRFSDGLDMSRDLIVNASVGGVLQEGGPEDGGVSVGKEGWRFAGVSRDGGGCRGTS